MMAMELLCQFLAAYEHAYAMSYTTLPGIYELAYDYADHVYSIRARLWLTLCHALYNIYELGIYIRYEDTRLYYVAYKLPYDNHYVSPME